MNLVPQFGFLELILIAVIALIVVGPRDLPQMMRQAGRMVAKAKSMAAEFTSAFDQMARETEMEELRKEIDALKNDNVVTRTKREFDDALNPINESLRQEESALKSEQAGAPAAENSPDEKAAGENAARETGDGNVAADEAAAKT